MFSSLHEHAAKKCIKKKLYILGIIRHHEPSTETFLKLKDAYLGLKNVLQKPAPQLRAKASFIISYLYTDHTSIAGM